LVGLAVAGAVIGLLESKLRPILTAAAQTQAQNSVTALLERTVAEDLSARQVGYGDFVTIQRDESGAITALTCDMAAMNLLRTELVSTVLQAVDGLSVSAVEVPLGSLFPFELLWASGPTVPAKLLRTGAVSAEWESQFTEAGVNQTRHRIWLELSVPMTVLLAGGSVQTTVSTRLCVAETVIVGQVPDTYLRLDGASGST
jgi:sporulation protein YunB